MISAQTIPQILSTQARLRPDMPALIGPDGVALSYAELEGHVTRLAKRLHSIAPRDEQRGLRIAIALPNGTDISILLLAAASVGTAVPLNPRMTTQECEAVIEDTAVDALVVSAGAEVAAIAAAQSKGLPVLRLGADLRISGLGSSRRDVPDRAPSDIALLLFTSGSTGTPKRVPLSHRNLCRSARDVAKSIALSPSDRCLVMWEQFHIGGLVDLLLAPLISGGSLVAAGSFDAKRFYALAEKLDPTWFQAVPTTLAELVVFGKRHNISPPNLRLLRVVAAALSPAVQEEAADFFNSPIIRTLGMTEAGPLITSTALPPAPQKPGSVGKSAGPDLRILGPNDAPVPQGTIGQVAVRGENVFDGYEDNAEANAAAFRGAWFLTGDLGYLDAEGDLYLTGRKKEQINRGGEKISPQEVDDALLSHPAVAEAATFAVPHARLGEDVACALVLNEQASEAEVRDFLGERLAPHKIPSQILRFDALPRNPVGKIDKLALASMARLETAQEATFVAPRTANEKAVARIWCDELQLDNISIHQDFAGADGDSLSAVRILVALEARYGHAMPDDLLNIASSVYQMAAALDEKGISPPDSISSPSDRGETTITHAALSETGVFMGNPADALSGIRSRPELKLLLDFVIAHMTPKLARRAVADLARAKPGARLGLKEKLVLRWGLWRWRVHARDDMERVGVHDEWTRETVSQDALLYSDPSVPSTEKTLIVGFAGDRTRLLMPTYQVLAGLDPKRFELLLLIDRSRKLFEHGLPGMGSDLQAISDFLRNFADDRGYANIVGFGTSAGSLAVLAVAAQSGFALGVSAAPASLNRHASFARVFAKLKAEGSLPPMRIVHADRAPDKAKAQQLKTVFPKAETIAYGTTTKNVMRMADQAGEFKAAFETWLAIPKK